MKQALRLALFLIASCALVAARHQSRPFPELVRTWRIAFVRDGSIWMCNGDGSEQKLLIRNAYSPSWSPDRSRIAFARDGDIWVAKADGTGQQALTSEWAGQAPKDALASDVTLSWHPSNGSLTFSHSETFKAERASWPTPIVSARNVVAGSVVGRSIFDVRVSEPQPGKPAVRYDLFTNGTSFFFADHAHPAWSPSGRELAFTRNGDIWILEAKGELEGEPPSGWNAKRIAAVAQFDEPLGRASRDNRGATRLSWHADGRRLAYAYERLQGSGFNEVHVIDTLSGQDSVVVRDGLEPCVSPDGRFILYRGYGDACGPDGFCICVASLNGKSRLKLVPRGTQPVW
jgi:Tol biopolymer transport system component